VPPELPLDAHMLDEEALARRALEKANAIAASRGVRASVASRPRERPRRGDRGRGRGGGRDLIVVRASASGPAGALRQDRRLRPAARALSRARDASMSAAPAAPLVARTKRLLIGRPRSNRELEETLLSKTLALPIFSSDPISSVAYATEAAMAVLITASCRRLHFVLPISLAVSVLLAIVVLSYSQGVKAYASSGGSYVFARENLGTLPHSWPAQRC
jgi:hypothetical protein